MGHFARECRAPISQERGRKDNYRQGSKNEEKTPKALMAIDGVGWDWSYMANEGEDYALVADEEAPTEFALMANTESKVFDNSLCSKDCKKNNDSLKIESQRSDKIKDGVGYCVVLPPIVDLYLSPKKDLSWTGLPEFADDTVTDYSRPSPTVESTSEEGQNRNSSTSEDVASPITPKSFVKFVKSKDFQSKSKTNKKETPKKPQVKYTEQYKQSNKKPNVRGNQRNWNNLKSYQLGPEFVLKKKACFNCGDFTHLANNCRKRVKGGTTRNNSPVNRNFSTGRRNFPTANRKFPTASRKFPTDSTKIHTADMGRKEKAVKSSTCWFWKPSHNLSNKGPNNNSVSVMLKKYTYIDIQGILKVANQEETPSLDNIPSLTNRFEDILRVESSPDEAIKVEADVNNMETTITATPTPTLRIHKDHPKSQIIGPMDTPIQIRHKSKEMDVKSAFFYGTTDEEVYVMQPLGFQDLEFSAKVYKVEKALYGLHQAPRAWYGTLSKYLLMNGFQRGTIDQTLFIRRQRGDFILFQVYVDDIISGSSNLQLCREFEAFMHKKFQMSAMGDILKKFRYSDVRSSNTPMDKENPWRKDEAGKDVDIHLYRSMIGSLLYLTASRPDIMFAICACAR
nr:hypothetical protein [Tanacetum cinerariifolium]